MTNRILATYRIASTNRDALALAEDICIEQTVEAHRSLVTEGRFTESIIGKVQNIESVGDDLHDAVISYPQRITAWQIPQLLNVLYGNISLKEGIRLMELALPESFTDHFPGPRWGIQGIRDRLGVHDRPLLAAALKPMGLTARELADRALPLSLGGIDILKDDHGLADHEFCPFEQRVRAVTEAVEKAHQKTGRTTLYFPSITERFDRIEARIDMALEMGAHGVLLSPLVTGLDVVRHLAERTDPAAMIMAHPALTGTFFSSHTHGISPTILLGTLMQLAGADLVIYPTHGGRFPLKRRDCLAIADTLRTPLHSLSPAWPVVAGGIDIEKVDTLISDYGRNTVLLVGSSLYTSTPDLETNARRFLSMVK